jgi:DNA helicase-2/ATP-dependent DNA helicase PcrA
MSPELEIAFDQLSPIQREAVNWSDGAALVLAGPGAGKTRVLTARIAQLLSQTPEKKFRILALTFTNKAASEMRDRVQALVPDMVEERTFIGTFHSFCIEILGKHGSHIGIKPDFTLNGRKEDQEDLLADAIKAARSEGKAFLPDDTKWLKTIRRMKSSLIVPEKALAKVNNPHFQAVYQLYEDALRAENSMDFESLILETCRLLAKMPAIAARIRQSYPYWLIDEFQDTTPAQSWLLYYLSGQEFKNIFVVADDDQIIYQWAGASYRQIEKFRERYKPELIQLVENHRCPPEIVTTANQLVAHNTQRTPEKYPTTPGRNAPLNAMALHLFDTDLEECESLTAEILSLGADNWGDIAILGRTRALLEPILTCLKAHGIKAILSQSRDDFISPQFVWLQACLDQAIRPTNKRKFPLLVNAANRIADADLDPSLLMAEAEAAGQSYFEYWGMIAVATANPILVNLGSIAIKLAHSRSTWKKIVKEAIPVLLGTVTKEVGMVSDADEDWMAWTAAMKEIRAEMGQDLSLADVIQSMALRSKEPPRDPDAVALLTVHSSKGLEFKMVYVVGLAEGEMPLWQSCNAGDTSPEMEEERRNCFVAITRTKEKLNLSAAKTYRGRQKGLSRFLKEMSLIS